MSLPEVRSGRYWIVRPGGPTQVNTVDNTQTPTATEGNGIL